MVQETAQKEERKSLMLIIEKSRLSSTRAQEEVICELLQVVVEWVRNESYLSTSAILKCFCCFGNQKVTKRQLKDARSRRQAND
jgi:hypothetical protein